MPDSTTPKEEQVKPTIAQPPKPAPLTVPQEIKHNTTLIQRAVQNLEPRFTARALRTLTNLRKKLYREALSEAINASYPENHAVKSSLVALIEIVPTRAEKIPETVTTTAATATVEEADSMQVDEPESKETEKKATVPVTEILPESDIYLRLLVLLALIDAKSLDKAFELAQQTTQDIQSLNRRSLDHLSAKVWFYLARVAELLKRDEEVRPLILSAHSTASLRHDEDVQATLLNLLLRNYFNASLYDQADKLLSKTTLPESAGNPQLARYLFYLGRMRAIQLNYTEAHTHLQHAIRRAPPESIAPGFLQTVYKYFTVVELLMGDIPERSIFRRPVLRKPLGPYFQLVQAVRVGDLEAFESVLKTHRERFIADGTHSLTIRLRHNVIKTALRMISLAYSRISLRDICLKLHLDSEEDTEYIVAKAIRDGVIDAEVDHAKGWMKSREAGNVYETEEPQKAFQQRIEFCLNLHNESVKAMRYPLDGAQIGTEDSELMRERKLDIEAALAEEDDGMDE